MDIHGINARRIRHSNTARLMQNIGYMNIQIDEVENTVTFASKLTDSVTVSLGDWGKISDTIANHERIRQTIGFTTGYVLDPSEVENIKVPDRNRDQVRRALNLGGSDGDVHITPFPRSYLDVHGVAANPIERNAYQSGYRVQTAVFKGGAEGEAFKAAKKLFADDKGEMRATFHPTGSGGVQFTSFTDISTGKKLSRQEIDVLREFETMSNEDLLSTGGKRNRGAAHRKTLTSSMSVKDSKVHIFDVDKSFGPMIDEMEKFYEPYYGKAGAARDAAKAAVNSMFDGMNLELDHGKLVGAFGDSHALQVGSQVETSSTYAYGHSRDQSLKNLREYTDNFRGANIRVSKYSTTDGTVHGQLKGDIIPANLTNKQIHYLMKHGSADRRPLLQALLDARQKGAMILSPSTNIGKELIQTGDALNSSIAMELRHDDSPVRTNRIMQSAHPEMLGDIDKAAEYSRKLLEEAYDELDSGKISPGLESHLRRMANKDPFDLHEFDVPTAAKIQDSIEESKKIINNMDAGLDIFSDPILMNRLRKSASDMVIAPGKGRAAMLIPGAERRAIVTDNMVLNSKYSIDRALAPVKTRGSMFNSKGQLRTGYAAIGEGGELVLSSEDPTELARILHNLGGADLDDKGDYVFRYSEKQKTMKIILARQPTGYGETVTLNMGLDEPHIKKLLLEEASNMESGPVLDLANKRSGLMDDIRELERIVNSRDGRHIYGNLEPADWANDRDLLASKKTQLVVAEQELIGHSSLLARSRFETFDIDKLPAEFVGYGDNATDLVDGTIGPKYQTLKEVEEVISIRNGKAVLTAEEATAALGKLTSAEVAETILARENILAQVINASTVFDSIRRESPDLIASIGAQNLNTWARETSIDTFQKIGTDAKEFFEYEIAENYKKIARGLLESDNAIAGPRIGTQTLGAKLSFTMVGQKGLGGEDMIPNFAMDAMRAVFGEEGRTLEEFIGTEAEDMSPLAQAVRRMERLKEYAEARDQQNKYRNPLYKANAHSSEIKGVNETAEELVASFKGMAADYGADDISKLTSPTVMETEKLAFNRTLVNDDFSKMIVNAAKETSKATGQDPQKVLQEILLSVRSSASQDEDVLAQMLSLGTTDGDQRRSVSVMLRNAQANQAIDQYDADMVLHGESRVAKLSPRLVRETREENLTGKEIMASDGSFRKTVREIGDSVTEILSGMRAPEGISLAEGGRRLWDIGHVRNTTIATAAVAAASIIYQRNQGRTEDSLEGPAFLPGGSNYESGVQRGNSYDIQGHNFNPSAGTTYNINASGSYDPYEFASRAGALAGAPAFGTISAGRSPFTDYSRAVNNNF
jgi:hypothetical protein